MHWLGEPRLRPSLSNVPRTGQAPACLGAFCSGPQGHPTGRTSIWRSDLAADLRSSPKNTADADQGGSELHPVLLLRRLTRGKYWVQSTETFTTPDEALPRQ